ncbi:MAG TPA: hypothetical protein VK907_14315 [Phnomibacter sp.]|nr:hypothetical protein [Phnomibacter sp.]
MNLPTKLTHILRASALFAFLFSVSTMVFAQKGTPYYTASLEGKNIRDVEVVTSGGSITVMNEAGEKTRIEVYIRGNNGNELSNAEIEKRLKDKYDFVIETSDNKVKAIAKRKSDWTDWKNALNISFKIYVPAKVATSLKTSGGSISLKGLEGKQDFATSGGSLKVEDIKGNVLGRTSGGSISVSGVQGSIEMKTSGGSITVSNSKGDMVLKTSGGSLKLDNLSGKVEAHTSGGSISGSNISGELKTGTSGGSVRLASLRGSVDASTSGGSMDVSLAELGSYVKLRNSAGGISLRVPAGKGLDLDISGQNVSVPNLSNFSGNTTNREIVGKVNGGGIPVSAKSSAGTIRVSFEN